MSAYPKSLLKLIENLGAFSGVGKRTATKMAFDILDMDSSTAADIARAIVNAKKNIKECKKCHHISEEEYCDICRNEKRNKKVICVVDSPRDLIAIENTDEYSGLYHVLHGKISPLDGVRPKDLRIDSLIERIKNENIEELILANSPTLEGEATALYISKILEEENILVSRIAHGVPVGGELEYSDSITLLKSIQGRKVLK